MITVVPLDLWTQVKQEYFPPTEEVVWTSDGHAVRKGVWHFEPGIALEKCLWTDEQGEPITVTHWCGLDETLDNPPGLPPALLSVGMMVLANDHVIEVVGRFRQ